MSFWRYHHAILLLALMLLVGCGGESTQDKILRMARERGKRNASESSEAAKPAKTESKPDESKPADPPAKKDVDVQGKPDAAAVAKQADDKPKSEPNADEAEPESGSDAVASSELQTGEAENNEVVAAPEATLPRRDELMSFGRLGTKVAYVGSSQAIGVYDVASKKVTRNVFNANLSPFSMAISDSGSHLAVGGIDGGMKVFSIESLSGLDKFRVSQELRGERAAPHQAHKGPVTAIAISDQAGLVATGGDKGEIKLWSSDESQPRVLPGPGSSVVDLLSYQNDQLLFAATEDGVSFWRLDNKNPVPSDFAGGEPLASPATVMVPGPEGKGLAVGDGSGHVKLWTIEGGEIQTSTFKAHDSAIAALGFSGEGESLYTVSQRGEVAGWQMPIRPQESIGTVEPAEFVLTSPDAELVAVPSRDKNLDLYSLADGRAVRRHSVRKGKLTAAEFSSDGRVIALANDLGEVLFEDDRRRPVAFQKLGDQAVTRIIRQDRSGQFAYATSARRIGVSRFASASDRSQAGGEVAAINAQGTRLVAASKSDVRAVRASDGKVTNSGRLGNGQVTAMSLDQNLAIIGSDQGDVWMWPYLVNGSKPELVKKGVHTAGIVAVGMTPFGGVWTADAEGTVQQTSLGRQPETSSGSTGFAIKQAVMLKDGSVFALDEQEKIRRADKVDGTYEVVREPPAKRLVGADEQVAALSSDGRSVHLFDSAGEPVRGLSIAGEATISQFDFDGRLLSLALSDGAAVAVRMNREEASNRKFGGGAIDRCVASATARTIVATDENGEMYVAGSTGRGRSLDLRGLTNARPVALSDDGRLLLVATRGRTVLFDIARQTPRQLNTFPKLIDPAAGAFSADGTRIALSLPSGEVHLVSVSQEGGDGEIASQSLGTTESPAAQIRWSRDGERIACMSSGGKLVLFGASGDVLHQSDSCSAVGSWSDGFVFGTSSGEVLSMSGSESSSSPLVSGLDGAVQSICQSGRVLLIKTDRGTAYAFSPSSACRITVARGLGKERPMAWGASANVLTAVMPDARMLSQSIPAVDRIAEPSTGLVKVVNVGASTILGLRSDGNVVRCQYKSGAFSDVEAVESLQGIKDMISVGDDVAVAREKQVAVFRAAGGAVDSPLTLDADFDTFVASSSDMQTIVRTSTGLKMADLRRGSIDEISGDFSKMSDGRVVSRPGRSQQRWIAFEADGKFVEADRLVTGSNSGSYKLDAASGQVSIEGGFLFAVVGRHVEVRRADGSVARKIQVSDEPVTCLGVHSATGSVAAADRLGRVVIAHSGNDTTTRHSLPVRDPRDVVWSDDGRSIAVTDGKRIAVVYVGDGVTVSQTLASEGIGSLVGWRDGRVWFFDGQSSLRRLRPPTPKWELELDDVVNDFAWSLDGRFVVAALANGTVVQLDAVTGLEVRRVGSGKSNVRNLVPIPNADSILMLASPSEVLLYDLSGQLGELPINVGLQLRSLAVSRDGRWLYGSNQAGQVLSWDLADLQKPPATVPCNVSCRTIRSVSGDRLVAAGDGEAKLALVSASMRLQVVERLGSRLANAEVSSGGRFVAASDQSSTVRLVSLAGGAVRELRSDGVAFDQLSVAPGGAYVAALGRTSVGQDATMVIWNAVDSAQAARVKLQGEPTAIRYSRDGSLVAVVFRDQHIEVFDGATGKMLEALPKIAEGVRAVNFSEGGTQLYVARNDGSVSVLALRSLGRAKASRAAIVSLSFHGGGKYLLCASLGGEMTLWNRAAFNKPQAGFRGSKASIIDSEVSSDGRYVLAVYEDDANSTYVWDLEVTGNSAMIDPTLIIKSDVKSTSAAFTSDSKFLLVGGVDGSIRAWSLGESREVARFEGHEGPVMDIAPLQTAGHFVSGGNDHSVRSWRFPSSLPAPGAEIPKGALADATEVRNLEPAEITDDVDRLDPNSIAREALIAGAGTTDIVDLMDGTAQEKQDVKASLKRIMQLENSSNLDATALSRERRKLAQSQQRLAPAGEAQSTSAWSSNQTFSNLMFVADTNFKFGIDDEETFRPVKLLFADRFLYAARTSVAKKKEEDEEQVDEGDNGALLSWDFEYSRLQAHAWSIDDLTVRELFALPNSAGVFTVPQVMLFSQDGSSRKFPRVASWATTKPDAPGRQYLAVGTAGAVRSESDILKIFDIADFSRDEISPYSQYRSFEGVVTAMAYANNAPYIAFCVRERSVHRLFIADAASLRLHKIEEASHAEPWAGDGSRQGYSSITSLAFSPDDDLLIAHGRYGEEYKFKRWELEWDDQSEFVSAEPARKVLTSEDKPFFLPSGSRSIRFVTDHGSSEKIVLVRVSDGFATVNLRSGREVKKIRRLSTFQGWPEYAVSSNGKWLIMGDDNGMAYVYNTVTGDKYGLSVDKATETRIKSSTLRLKDFFKDQPQRPAHSGPIVGVALSEPDANLDYPAFAATIGEENTVKVWELYPILDIEEGLRSRSNEGIRRMRQKQQSLQAQR